MKTNIIYNIDCIDGLKKLKDESVDLIVADPPYFKVIGETWDYSIATLNEYIEWTKNYLKQLFRVLRKGGTFYLFGYFRVLAHLVEVIESEGFELRQQIIVDKGIKAVAGRATKAYKIFPNTTESILFFIKDSKPFVKKLLKDKQKSMGLSSKEINEALGVKSNGGGMWSIYTGNNMCKQLPTKEIWLKLCSILDIQGIEYEKISQTFNPIRYHPTQKPIKLIERLILASSNEGDIVLDPFMGSGSTALACIKNNRLYIGYELSEEYYKLSLQRINELVKD